MWSLSLITPPASEALDLSPGGEVYQHLRLEPELTPQDALLQTAVAAARTEGERITRRQFITATWELTLGSWYEPEIFRCGRLVLPLPPLQSVTSVKYIDGAGVEQTWSSSKFTVSKPAGDFPQRGSIYPNPGESFPGCASFQWAGETYPFPYPWGGGSNPRAMVKVQFVAGYGDTPATIPGLLRSAMLLTVGEIYERRELATVGSAYSKNIRSASGIFLDNRAW